MEEVRSDLFTVLANFMESQPQGVQNTQSNNNNSNPVSALRADPINRNGTTSQATNMTRNSQIEASTVQSSEPSVNTNVLDPNIPPPSARIQNTVGSTSDADMVEIERISSTFPHLAFPASSCTVSNTSNDSLIYEGDNHVGMVEEVANGIDPRIAAYTQNSLDFSQNPAALLEALSSMDKDNFGESTGVTSAASVPCLRAEPAHAFAQSFVSMLQQQQIDSCSLWPMNSVQTGSTGTTNFNGDIGNTKQAMDVTGPQPTAASSNTCFSPQSAVSLASSGMDAAGHSHLMHNAPTSKAALLTQQSRMPPAEKVNLVNQHYGSNSLQQYSVAKHGSKNRNDLMLPIAKEETYIDVPPLEGQGKEKKLTTTPIPSDADKSSSSGSSSGSVSGPEHSPDHRISHVRGDLNTIHGLAGKHQSASHLTGGPQNLSEGGPQNLSGSKNYPHNNVNMMNFNTINFSPVMEGIHAAGGADMRKIHLNQDINVPVPTSDSVVEIDETVTSPLENIPVSPPTPTSENDILSPPKFTDTNADTQKAISVYSNHLSVLQNQGSNAPMPPALQHIASVNIGSNVRGTVNMNGNTKFDTQKGPVSRNPSEKRDANNNNTQFFNKNAVNPTPEKFKEKQKKPRRSRNQQQNHRHKNGQDDNSVQERDFHTLGVAGNNMTRTAEQHSNLTPKVNADPTRKKSSGSRGPQLDPRNGSGTMQPFHTNNVGNNGMPGPGFPAMPNLIPTGHHTFSTKQSNSMPAADKNNAQQSNRGGGGRRQWQTVTAVQGPKLPPMLSEQDRIPKRGRPSKKMMQENLKIKNNASTTSTAAVPTTTAVVKTPTEKVVPVPTAASKLVSTYTINDKGLMEEIAPKLKENRRSKERTQAFLKLLDDIKCASKQNKANPKFGEKAKTSSEKQVKKRAKPRTKVFGRNVSEPLTESGITETMYTFSALAHQYKISSSIVERATENLLKSAAMKRSKEQLATGGAVISSERLRQLDKNRKGVPMPVSHCESKTVNISSKVPVPTMQSLPAKSVDSSMPLPIAAAAVGVSSNRLSVSVSSATGSVTAPAGSITTNVVKPRTTSPITNQNFVTASGTKESVPVKVPPPEPVPEVIEEFSPKSKSKKKKHKKHKKHKHIESKAGLSGKKKKKKKKERKKPKVKIGHGALPSSSVAVAKPPFKSSSVPQATASLSLPAAAMNTESPAPVPRASLQEKPQTFSSPFQRTSVETNNDINDWQPDDNAYDGEDSSSDEASTSPKSYPEAASQDKQVSTPKAGNLSSFARYSDSPMGFGMLTSQKQVPRTQAREEPPATAIVAEKSDQAGSFSSSIARSKKHHKHNKRKRFSRKPRNICNPALLVHLDEILDKMKNLAFATLPRQNRPTSSNAGTNVFLAVSASDNTSEALWRLPTASSSSAQKGDGQAGIVKGTAFRNDSMQSGGRGSKPSTTATGFTSTIKKNLPPFSSSSNANVCNGGNTLSVFCSSPFFQKYGYISKLSATSSSSTVSTTTRQPTKPTQFAAPADAQRTPCASMNTSSTVQSSTERIVDTKMTPDVSSTSSPAQPIQQEKRKRGWPRGKPRGPRSKKARLIAKTTAKASPEAPTPEAPTPASASTQIDSTLPDVPVENATHSQPTASDKADDVIHPPDTKDQSGPKTASKGTSVSVEQERPGTSGTSVASTLESDLGKLVGESLLSQIKQAIEASLPAHPSVNKDAITKSVDAVVQSYLQKMNLPPESTPDIPTPLSVKENSSKKRPGKRSMRSRSSVDSTSENTPQASADASSRTNADKHPKKLWACKHHDTETLAPSAVESAGVATDSPAQPVKKRGPGRPRKNPLPDTEPAQKDPKFIRMPPTQCYSRQGKLPTASATVVPVRKKTPALRMQGMPFSRKVPAVRMRGKCGRPRLIPLDTTKSESPMKDKVSTSPPYRPLGVAITKERAFSSLNALYSAKALRSKSRVASFENVTEPGLYAGTIIEDHIKESIDNTVDQYSWDNYRKFKEACARVEQEMGFVDDNENAANDSKRRASIPKKSIESVVEKLKNKQAQSMHSAATALLQLRETHVPGDREDEQTVVVKNTSGSESYLDNSHRRRRDSYDRNTSVEKSSKSHFDKRRQSSLPSDGSPPLKRPRGRPRKIPLPDQESLWSPTPPKKQRTESFERKQSDSKKEKFATGPRKDTYKKHSTGHKDKGKILSPTRTESGELATLPAKSYLEAGLYSSTFKKNSKSSKSEIDDESSDAGADSDTGLPPPFDAGLYVRSSLKDFQLPYNIWWMYKHHKIAVSQDPSTQYVEITENVYSAPRPTANLGDHICTCRVKGDGVGCGKQCLNRLIYFECSPSSCPCGSGCSNQMIQNAEWCSTLQRFKTDNKGWGVRTTDSICDGAFILEYVGEVLSEAEFRTRTVELYHAYNDHYCVQLDSSTVIDGYRMANEGRFVNHSCDPNCEIQKWCVNGEYRIGLFALREIRPGEELTYDYNFHAYNLDRQQVCRCGSCTCRGIIGGRTQRSLSSESEVPTPTLSVSSVKPTKSKQSKSKKSVRADGGYAVKDDDLVTKEFSILQMKPLSPHERNVIRIRQLFLIRNLAQVRRKEEEQQRKLAKKSASPEAGTSHTKSSHKSKTKKNQNKEESKRVEEALTEMYTAIATCKDQNGVSVAIPFMNLPSKKKNPEYYERISNPIDLSVIERNLMSHHYKDIETFNNDVQRVFKNAEKYHGRKSTLGKDVTRLRKAYAIARGKVAVLMNGYKKPSKTCDVDNEDLNEGNDNIHRKNEDHIRCICCIYKDEGLMVQCEKCYVWQHCDCMGVKPGNTDRYLCEECDPRPVSKEVKVIPPPPNTPPGHTYYVTLLRDNILVKQGDCAYLMRDHRLRHNSDVPSMRALNRNLANIPQENLDIFRIEKLWTDERGDKFAYGYHFLRPHETHHSPSRTFYPNELFGSPFYEIIPLEAVVGLCIVMDLYTYCKGKPKGFKMSDIYICDFRIDKAAGIFTRINKKRFPICTKPHVFDTYKHRLCPKKNFQPHQVPEQYKRQAGRPPLKHDADVVEMDLEEKDAEDPVMNGGESDDASEGPSVSVRDGDQNDPTEGTGKWTKKRQRLEGIAHKLLSKLPKQAVDVSYLLEPGAGKRQRKKTLLSLESLSQQK